MSKNNVPVLLKGFNDLEKSTQSDKCIIVEDTPFQFLFWTLLKMSKMIIFFFPKHLKMVFSFHLKAKAIFQYAKLGSYRRVASNIGCSKWSISNWTKDINDHTKQTFLKNK